MLNTLWSEESKIKARANAILDKMLMELLMAASKAKRPLVMFYTAREMGEMNGESQKLAGNPVILKGGGFSSLSFSALFFHTII